MDEKKCTKCGETKPLDEFYQDGRNSDGRRGACKACMRASSRSDEAKARKRQWYEKNAPRLRREFKERYHADPGKFRQRSRDYYTGNAEWVKQRERQYRVANHEAVLQREASYREANRDRIRQYFRDLHARSPHRAWKSTYLNRARSFGVTVVVEEFTKSDVLDRYGDACTYCETGPFEHLDHYVPVKDGGPHTLDNVRPSCANCNLAKSDLDPAEWLAEQDALDNLTEDELDDLIDAEIDRWTK